MRMGKIKAVTVHAGHNKPGKVACGASDYIDESREARIICKKVIRLLRKNGIKAYNCTVNNGTSQVDVLKKIVRKCNQRQRQLDISIHFNSAPHAPKDGRTTGTEVLVLNKTNMKADVAGRVCRQISQIGFKNRGVKERDDLYVLRYTTAPALLIEVCFVSDQDDANLYKKHRDDVARAIVQAILDYNKSCR